MLQNESNMPNRDAPFWLAAGLRLRKPSLCIYHNSFRGLSICRIQKRCLEGREGTPYKTQEERIRESEMKRSKIFKDSSVPGFLKCCSNYTLFHVLRQNLHVKCSNLFPFTTVTLRPLKKAEADFLLMKAIWPRNSIRHNFFFLLRLKLR